MGSREGGERGAEDGTGLVNGMPSFSSLLPGAQSVYVDSILLVLLPSVLVNYLLLVVSTL